MPAARELFDRLYQRRMLIRLVGVRFSASSGNPQLNLFEDTSEMIPTLYMAVDRGNGSALTPCSGPAASS
ncbi:MAG: hypothetical protein R2751_12325 [Bacteroidales bacterium]